MRSCAARVGTAWWVGALSLGAAIVASPEAFADDLLVTADFALPGQTYGLSLTAQQYLGVRFENTAPWLVQEVGGHLFQNGGGADGLFVAIVPLTDGEDFPNDVAMSEAVWHATFEAPRTSNDVSVDSGVLLLPGWYALVFGGGGQFGSTGTGGLSPYDVPVGYPSYIRMQNGVWEDSAGSTKRFFIRGLVQCIEDTGDQEIDCVEECFDGYDNDADGWFDCQDTDCWFFTECCDADLDGYARADEVCSFGPDCNDYPDVGAGFNPGTGEIPADGVDQNCDGVDSCYADQDLDGWGSNALVILGDDLDCSTGPLQSAIAGDCNDVGAFGSRVNPAAEEIPADGVDQDCDGRELCFEDADGDGYGKVARVLSIGGSCAGIPGASPSGEDCDDAAADIYPLAPETPGDGVDQDCDGVDTCYVDRDGDRYGVPTTIRGFDLECNRGRGMSERADDCNDGLQGVRIHPGAEDAPADRVDQDCDGLDACWLDADLDGHGGWTIARPGAVDCDAQLGVASLPDDCDDDPATGMFTWPGAPEIPGDGIDQSCDGSDLCWFDRDRDGYGSAITAEAGQMSCADALGFANNGDDCRDIGIGAAQIHPGVTEIPDDGVDQDCDFEDACWLDADQDGAGGAGLVDANGFGCGDDPFESTRGDDCDDLDPTIGPLAPEVVADQIDQDCSGHDGCFVDADDDLYGTPVVVDDALDLGCAEAVGLADRDGDCDDRRADVHPFTEDRPYDDVDQDCSGGDPRDVDGDRVEAAVVGGPDCDDLDPSVRPGVGELENGRDDDCDGEIDEDTRSYDDDGDGFAERGGDCDDARSGVRPGGREICDGLDQDCDGVLDEETSCFDDDGDGASEAEGDCHDGDPRVGPGRSEVLDNGVDDDCDGIFASSLADIDRDGFLEDAGDCAPYDHDIHPGAVELPDGVDDDCDGAIDEGTVWSDDDGDGVAEVDGDCHDGDRSVGPAAPEIPENGVDDDCDGVVDPGGRSADEDRDGVLAVDDCDDADPDRAPGAPERANGVDDDCDGAVDEGTDDADGDGYAVVDGDCSDEEGWRNPGATEACDGVDNDCDGFTDEGCGPPNVVGVSNGCDQGGGAGGAALMGALGWRWSRRRRFPAPSSRSVRVCGTVGMVRGGWDARQ
jgi:hypothetical protein